MITTYTIFHVVFLAIGIIAGWLAKHYHVGIPTTTLSALRGFLAEKQKKDLADVISGINQGQQIPQG